MYYSSGTYEAFVNPRKVKDADKKSAYIVGSGLAGLSAAFYLVRDAKVKGENIHILETLPRAGGSCDGYHDINKGYYMRGGREMDNHFECMWDLYRSVPSIENKGMTVLDEYYYLNKEDPNYSLCRATVNRGENANTKNLFTLDREAQNQLLKLYLTPEKDLEDKKISECFDDHFWKSNFWLYWQTMFAFQRWSSALEMKRYIQRYVHHIDGLPDFSALRFTKYNQYESMILPLEKYLEEHGVKFEFDTKVTDVKIKKIGNKRIATQMTYEQGGKEIVKDLTTDDLLFITNGCCTDVSRYGDNNTAPNLEGIKPNVGDGWNLWEKIAAQDTIFGNPKAFASNIEETNWMSASVFTKDPEIIGLIKDICKRDPLSGKVTTGGIVTVKDSFENWGLSWTINRQPQFKEQEKGSVIVWLYSLYTNVEGNYVKKPMRECTGQEICKEWLYHIGAPISKIDELSKKCNTTTCFMPFINAFFQPRKNSDRPKVVPEGCVNLAFLGQFAETPRDTIFTTEYSIRTGMEAVYTLLDVERAVPEVWGSAYDVREMLRAAYYAIDKKKITEMDLSWSEKIILKKVLAKIKDTDIETWIKDSGLL